VAHNLYKTENQLALGQVHIKSRQHSEAEAMILKKAGTFFKVKEFPKNSFYVIAYFMLRQY